MGKVLFLHLGSVMTTINSKTAITLFCLAFILIGVSLPLYLNKIKMNHFYGFRLRKAFESEENWYAINRYGGKVMTLWSVVIIVLGIVCLYVDPQHVLTVSKIAFLSVLVPIAQTVWYARKF